MLRPCFPPGEALCSTAGGQSSQFKRFWTQVGMRWVCVMCRSQRRLFGLHKNRGGCVAVWCLMDRQTGYWSLMSKKCVTCKFDKFVRTSMLQITPQASNLSLLNSKRSFPPVLALKSSHRRPPKSNHRRPWILGRPSCRTCFVRVAATGGADPIAPAAFPSGFRCCRDRRVAFALLSLRIHRCHRRPGHRAMERSRVTWRPGDWGTGSLAAWHGQQMPTRQAILATVEAADNKHGSCFSPDHL